MAKDISDKKCENCKHSEYYGDVEGGYVCEYPPIKLTFKSGVPCVEARGCGRYCGPNGEMFEPRR